MYEFHLAEATGHSQYASRIIKRRWYCPFKGVCKEDWLAAIKSEEQAIEATSTATTAPASGSDTNEMN